jgi:hypothetical protein
MYSSYGTREQAVDEGTLAQVFVFCSGYILLLWLYAVVDALIASFIYSHFYRSIHVHNPYLLTTDLEDCLRASSDWQFKNAQFHLDAASIQLYMKRSRL